MEETPNLITCPICNGLFKPWSNRRDVHGKEWCRECTEEFDSIDWEAEWEKRNQ